MLTAVRQEKLLSRLQPLNLSVIEVVADVYWSIPRKRIR